MKYPYETISQLINTRNLPYETITNDKGYSEKELMEKNGLVLHQGAKSMILKTNDNFLLVILAGDRKLDIKKIKEVFNIQQVRLATNNEIKMLMGCEIGSCYPIGELINLKTYVDASLSDNEKIFFNPGVSNKWLLMTWKNFVKLTNPTIINVAQ